MRTKTAYVVSVGIVILGLTLGVGLQANSNSLPLDKVGVVSIMRVMQTSARHSQAMNALGAQRAQHQAELQQLSQELETDRAALQTMKPGSEDHLKQLKEVFDKQATIESRQEYYRQALTAKEGEITESIYRRILEATQRVADVKGLTMVLEQSAPQFPIPSDRLLFTISSHKVLYAKGCVDITDAVLAEVDK